MSLAPSADVISESSLILFTLHDGVVVLLVVVVPVVHACDVDGVGLGARPEEDARDGVHRQVERAEQVLAAASALQ